MERWTAETADRMARTEVGGCLQGGAVARVQLLQELAVSQELRYGATAPRAWSSSKRRGLELG